MSAADAALVGCRPACCSLPVLCACCSHCTTDLPGCDLSWRTCCCHVQVQRASGAFMVSHRRQSMGLPPGLGPPGLTGPAGAVMETTSSMASEDVEAGEGSLVDDEEFVAEEHAHRCVPCRPVPTQCVMAAGLCCGLSESTGWCLLLLNSAHTLSAGPEKPKSCAEVPAVLLSTHRSCVLQPPCLPLRSRHQHSLPTWHLHSADLAVVPHLPRCVLQGGASALMLLASLPAYLEPHSPCCAPAGWNSSASRVRWTACSALWKPRRPRCSA